MIAARRQETPQDAEDPWNQAVFAAPMVALYLISIGIAWAVAPRGPKDPGNGPGSPALRLVVGAMVMQQIRTERS